MWGFYDFFFPHYENVNSLFTLATTRLQSNLSISLFLVPFFISYVEINTFWIICLRGLLEQLLDDFNMILFYS